MITYLLRTCPLPIRERLRGAVDRFDLQFYALRVDFKYLLSLREVKKLLKCNVLDFKALVQRQQAVEPRHKKQSSMRVDLKERRQSLKRVWKSTAMLSYDVQRMGPYIDMAICTAFDRWLNHDRRGFPDLYVSYD